ncbi:Fumitremorgin C monooxygenase-like protein [Colletotrichum scovillei]|uniref:Fumitremorgin C monooxygenase-like protein n=1 Tax=Colletotrichum scovillei TaxID=1209932 RepID=UPI0015C3F58B|nr:Fumitremorgin C monooxygenase-like protein [Colletotrichum scovillei]KAF4772771.1 Fumitremorgin C monooxygenase-like protein [Colletotrichum scovillei]
MDVLAAWYPEEANQTLGFTYMEYIVETNDILINSVEGHIWVVHRGSCRGRPYFKTTRKIDMVPELQQGDRLLNSMFDTEVLTGDGSSVANTTTYGYITPSGKVHKARLDNEMVENGLAVAGTNVYMNTSPTGKNNKPNAPGYMYSLTVEGGEEGGIETRWRVPYDAGVKTELDPGAVTSRGSGTTPALLADKYVAIVDNDSPRLHLNVYHQKPQANGNKQLVCQVPLFTPEKVSVLNSVLGHYDSKREKYGIMIQNAYGAPPLYTGQNGQKLNGKVNDMSNMEGGVTRVDVDKYGNCSVRWTNDLRIKAVSVLSTKNGLVYSYIQDGERAAKGEYVWYMAGIDWLTGETVFQVRTGTGGAFNDNWTGGALGPDGTFYQTVSSGIVAIKDACNNS